jgi:23S rRNA pseudouridine1911/1915/1917 synthase
MVARAAIVVVVEDPADLGERADVVLGRRTPGLSRRAARASGLDGRLRINGRRATPSTRVALGDRLELDTSASETTAPGSMPDVEVLCATTRFVYVDKPAGMHTHRLRPSDPPCVADVVARRFPECATASEHPREGGAIHRLDRETSGVLAFARSRRDWTAGRRAIESGAFKLYLAVASGVPRWPDRLPGATLVTEAFPDPPPWMPAPSGSGFELRSRIGRGRDPTRQAVRVDGTPAVSRVWPLRPGPATTWSVAVQLLTGRRHQARVHLASVGLPIVGDARYGPEGSAGPLHLRAVTLRLDDEDGPVHAAAPMGWPTFAPP